MRRMTIAVVLCAAPGLAAAQPETPVEKWKGKTIKGVDAATGADA